MKETRTASLYPVDGAGHLHLAWVGLETGIVPITLAGAPHPHLGAFPAPLSLTIIEAFNVNRGGFGSLSNLPTSGSTRIPGGPQVGDDDDDDDENKEGENWFAGGERRYVEA